MKLAAWKYFSYEDKPEMKEKLLYVIFITKLLLLMERIAAYNS